MKIFSKPCGYQFTKLGRALELHNRRGLRLLLLLQNAAWAGKVLPPEHRRLVQRRPAGVARQVCRGQPGDIRHVADQLGQQALDLGFSRIVGSGIAAPNI